MCGRAVTEAIDSKHRIARVTMDIDEKPGTAALVCTRLEMAILRSVVALANDRRLRRGTLYAPRCVEKWWFGLPCTFRGQGRIYFMEGTGQWESERAGVSRGCAFIIIAGRVQRRGSGSGSQRPGVSMQERRVVIDLDAIPTYRVGVSTFEIAQDNQI